MKTTRVNFTSLVRSVGCLLVVLLLSGCDDPESIVIWSPDGRWGLVRDGRQKPLIDESGGIVGQFAPAGDTKDGWSVESWMPDSRRAIAVHTMEVRNWSELASLLKADRAESVVRAAEELLGLVRIYHGDWDQLINDDVRMREWHEHLGFYPGYSLQSDESKVTRQRALMVFTCLREKFPVESGPLLQTSRSAPDCHELVLRNVRPGDAAEEQVLFRSPDPLPWVSPSPDGRLIAFVRSEPVRPVLYIIPAHGGGEPVRVDDGVAQASWTPDGQALVYQKTSVPFEMVETQAQLGTLTSRQVLDASGAIPAELAPPEDLVGTLFSKVLNRVACLPDGRILFVSCVISLPAVEVAERRSLFTVRRMGPRMIQEVVREVDRRSLPDRIDRFAVSPDGRYVALPGKDGEVSLLSLESGEVTPLQRAVAEYQQVSRYENKPWIPAPTWRGAGELCYLVPPGDPAGSLRRAEVVLQPLGGARRTISKGWSNAMTENILPRPKM
jgi:hypothetical protein